MININGIYLYNRYMPTNRDKNKKDDECVYFVSFLKNKITEKIK